MSGFLPTPEWLDERFESRIRRRVFFRGPQRQPIAVLLGGQPGAGKTRAAQFAQNLHENTLNVITGDDYRVAHPHYKWLQKHDPVAMPNATQLVSGPLVERAISYARRNELSVLVEGTFRRPEVSLQTAQQFHTAGYEVHVVALAVPPTISRMSAVARFYETLNEGQSRWTPLTAHEDAVENAPKTLEALGESPFVDRITVMDRSGTALMDSTTPGRTRARHARTTLLNEHRRSLTPDETAQIRHTYLENQRIANEDPVARAIANQPSVREAWRLLAVDQQALNS